MRLLICTQKVDKNDPILGFLHGWITAFAAHWEHIHVICLQEGEHDLPENVSVHSLGKLQATSYKLKVFAQLKYIWNFYRLIFLLRKEYDAVFVHMNQEYVLLGGIPWRLKGIRIGFWYNHTVGSFITRIAMFLSNVVFHTSPYAYTAHTKKSQRMPAGIDTDVFTPDAASERLNNSILFVGRISPIKGVRELIDACKILSEQGVTYTLDIYGEASDAHKTYEAECRRAAHGLPVRFHGAVANTDLPPIYASREIFVNLTPDGNYDKTVLEAMSCGMLVVASSKAFSDIIPDAYRPDSRDVHSIAHVLQATLLEDTSKKKERVQKYRKFSTENHSLYILAEQLAKKMA